VPFDGSDFSPSFQPTAEALPGSAPGWAGTVKAFLARALARSRAAPYLFTGNPAELIEPSTAHLLRRARTLIEAEEKWVQGYYSTSDGRRCAMGALRAAARHSDPRRVRARAHHLLREVARDRGFQSVEGMNDRCTHQQVLTAFDLAIRAAERSPRGD
jgi:hypothetical protein